MWQLKRMSPCVLQGIFTMACSAAQAAEASAFSRKSGGS